MLTPHNPLTHRPIQCKQSRYESPRFISVFLSLSRYVLSMTDSVCCLNYCSVLGLCLPFLRRVSLPPLLYLTPSHPHSTSRALLFPLLLVTSLSDPCPPLPLRLIAALPHYCLEVKKNRPYFCYVVSRRLVFICKI
jgi:hypothetical protein